MSSALARNAGLSSSSGSQTPNPGATLRSRVDRRQADRCREAHRGVRGPVRPRNENTADSCETTVVKYGSDGTGTVALRIGGSRSAGGRKPTLPSRRAGGVHPERTVGHTLIAAKNSYAVAT
jgi:hypothetical protein